MATEACTAGQYESYWNAFLLLLLPPATKLGQGYVFTHVCYSVYRGVSRPRPRGEVEGCGRGVSRPRPRGRLGGLARGWGVSRPTPGGYPGPHLGGVSQHALRQTPPRVWAWTSPPKQYFLIKTQRISVSTEKLKYHIVHIL